MSATGEYAAGFQVGYGRGYDTGWTAGYELRGDELTAAMTGVVPVLALPRQAELERLREVSHRPCPSQCRRCSACIHSLAYWSRGGRDYLGADAEAARQQGAA